MIPAKRQPGDTACTPAARFGHDAQLYRQRNAIERTFAKRKQFRRFATRYDKHAECFSVWFQIAATLMWVKPDTVHTPWSACCTTVRASCLCWASPAGQD